MRPSKSTKDMELKSLKKKYKSKGFADVYKRQEYMHQKNVEVVMHDMPSENWFLYYVLPILIVFIVFVFFFSLMNAQANGGGGASNKMMNFGKSRARMTTGGDVQITLKDVAGLKEEKEAVSYTHLL